MLIACSQLLQQELMQLLLNMLISVPQHGAFLVDLLAS